MSLARGGTYRRKWERLKAGESNGNLPLRNCLECRALPVAWLGSGSCQNRPSGWCTQVFLYGTPYSCQILMKLEFPRQIIEQSSNIKFNETIGWERSCAMRRADRYDKANSRFSKFCERAKKYSRRRDIFLCWKFSSSEMLRGVIGHVASDISKVYSVFIFVSWATLPQDWY